jgi:hypothetical protein
VPLARLGIQRYHASELRTVEAGVDGFIDADRPEHEVFDPLALSARDRAKADLVT